MVKSVSSYIRSDPPLWYGKYALYPYSLRDENRYIFETRFGDFVSLCRTVKIDGKRYMAIPRAFCPIGENDGRVDGPVVDFPKTPEPRPHQVEVAAEMVAFLKEGKSGLIEAPTGFGKTFLGYLAAATVRRRTLVITTKEDIYQQWIDGACGRKSAANKTGFNFLGLHPNEVGEIRGDKCEVLGGTKFCVGLIQSLSKKGKYPDWLQDHFGLIVCDECHRVPADQFSEVADMFNARIRIGLSATHERADGKEILLAGHIGPKRAVAEKAMLVPKIIRYHTGFIVPKVKRYDKATGQSAVVKLPHSAGKTMHVEKYLAADKERNEYLVDTIVTAYDKGRRIIVFSSLIEHLETLMNECNSRKVPMKDMGIYRAVTTKEDKAEQEKIKARRVIFTTYVKAGEGTDIPWLDTAVFATPRANIVQPAGRILREYEDKKFPLIIDPIDGDSRVFAGYAAKRLVWYKTIGAEVVDMTN